MNKGLTAMGKFLLLNTNWEINQISSEILIFFSDLFSFSICETLLEFPPL